MANKVYNMAGGLHSAAAYSGFENEVYGGNAVASPNALKVAAKSGMVVTVGKGNGLIDTGDDYARRVALTEPADVTIAGADTSLPRMDVIVIYVDNAVQPSTDQIDNTNGILKVVSVAGTPAASPSVPSAATIQQAIGAGNPYMVLANVRVNAGATAISAGNITDERPESPSVYCATIANILMPIGTIVCGAKPAWGVWERIQGRFLYASDSSTPVGRTGGAKTVALSVAQMPSHSHTLSRSLPTWVGSTNTNFVYTGGEIGAVDAGQTILNSTGGGQAHENMPPYLSVEMWRRTA